MNKQNFKNYFAGYKNEHREKLYKINNKFYITNLISIIKLNGNYGIDVSEEIDINTKKSLEILFDRFMNYEEVGYVSELDSKNSEYRTLYLNDGNILKDYEVRDIQLRKIRKVLTLDKRTDIKTYVVSSGKINPSYAIKMYNNIGEVAFLLPVKIY